MRSFVHRYDTVLGLYEASLRAGVTSGALRPDINPTALASEVTAMSDGLQIQWGLLARPGWDMAVVFRGYVDRLCRSITADGSGLGG
jgi:hypothetical protein